MPPVTPEQGANAGQLRGFPRELAMNKLEVASELDCSTRQVEKYAAENRFGTIEYVRGKRGREAKYDADAVARLKSELEAERQQIVGYAPREHSQSQALQRADSEQGIAMLASVLADALRATQTTGDGRQDVLSITDISLKLMLTEREAAAYSGLSLADIERARDPLKAIKTGAGWRVKRSSVEAYVKKL